VGTGSNANSHAHVQWAFVSGITLLPKITGPLDFDQRHKISAVVDYRFGQEDGPKWGNHYPLAGAGINILFRAGSGFPFTSSLSTDETTLKSIIFNPNGVTNSSRGPWSFQVDLKANRRIQLGPVEFSAFAWVINLMNRRNVSALGRRGTGIQSAVYSSTGSPVTTRWLHTSEGREFIQRFGEGGRERFLLKELDPANFSTPRQVRFGTSFGF